ncbi:hypothetical protein [Polycladidibacter stylochi]|uniref:hypothetical protein n=1 Tax=Polycladidibacter stylochi TaxID=1807766 RepID=UPI00082DF742|nr:hypothetical protein [Pseudovibrio stylochi]
MSVQKKTALGLLSLSLVVALNCTARAEQAVTRVSAGLGRVDGYVMGMGGANFRYDVGEGLISQYDISGGGLNNYGFLKGTAHVGFRKLGVGYFGFFGSASYINRENGSIGHAGAEAQLNYGPVTVDSKIGFNIIERSGSIMGGADISYYFNPDLRVYGGYHYVREQNLYAAGIEFRPSQFNGSNVTFFADARAATDDIRNITVIGGAKITFDAYRSLLDENRNRFLSSDYLLDQLTVK